MSNDCLFSLVTVLEFIFLIWLITVFTSKIVLCVFFTVAYSGILMMWLEWMKCRPSINTIQYSQVAAANNRVHYARKLITSTKTATYKCVYHEEPKYRLWKKWDAAISVHIFSQYKCIELKLCFMMTVVIIMLKSL